MACSQKIKRWSSCDSGPCPLSKLYSPNPASPTNCVSVLISLSYKLFCLKTVSVLVQCVLLYLSYICQNWSGIVSIPFNEGLCSEQLLGLVQSDVQCFHQPHFHAKDSQANNLLQLCKQDSFEEPF